MKRRKKRPLQCGRIYKDAEIREKIHEISTPWTPFSVAASIKMRKSKIRLKLVSVSIVLQCGRIYKDAEISELRRFERLASRPSMWPHL